MPRNHCLTKSSRTIGGTRALFRAISEYTGKVRGVVSYEVQGRRTERDAEGKAREVVRLGAARSSGAAFAIADAMVADDLAVWVFETTPRANGARAYRLLRAIGRATS